ncbi:protein EFR3 homolog B-like [Corticium candelabrum]|uniref:protein EFR3 homolog B-like n=1 Tax=Corticium candelabrum TaxID=121492 RepID=UPI002E254E87|nr:protein EFR3 homolog B-like [Corticium candelabrum]
MAVCGCCVSLKPRYKRHVDDIFPTSPDQPIVASQKDKLSYYALSAPEKLDRIGTYLAQRVRKDLSRRRYGYVYIALEALDELLITCRDTTLNLYVESFLRIVLLLLEADNSDLQMRAVQSFVQFSDIEETTPSYHRRYDFFVSRFSEMCYNNNSNVEMRTKLRMAGLRGLHGVVKKTVSDDLQVNIWQPIHMDKIAPALVFNMFDGVDLSQRDTSSVEKLQSEVLDDSQPSGLAETCLRDLLGRANFGNLKDTLSPILNQVDHAGWWVPNTFLTQLFQIILFSIQSQYSYVVIQLLIEQLDMPTSRWDAPGSQMYVSPARRKASIADVIRAAVPIAAGSAMGPSVLEIFHSLLQRMRQAIDDLVTKSLGPERTEYESYRDTLVNVIGTFACVLPDYQKIEVITYLVGNMPSHESAELVSDAVKSQDPTIRQQTSVQAEHMHRLMLIECFRQVVSSYRPHSLSSTFPVSLFDPLLRLLVDEDPDLRLEVHCIIQRLLDHYGNLEKISVKTSWNSIQELGLAAGQASKQDSIFMKKNGNHMFWTLYEYGQLMTNGPDHYAALSHTLALLSLSLGPELVIVDSVRIVLGLQDHALSNVNNLSALSRCCIHALTASFLHFLAKWTGSRELLDLTEEVISERQRKASYLLPDEMLVDFSAPESLPSLSELHELDEHLLFQRQLISNVLSDLGHEIEHLASPLERKVTERRRKQTISREGTMQEISGSEELGLSPVLKHRQRHASNIITFESLKKALTMRERDRKDDGDVERSRSYREIVAESDAKSQSFKHQLKQILDVATRSATSSDLVDGVGTENLRTRFPDVFLS